MSFSRFDKLLESSELYFARADLLGDPFEGSLPYRVVAERSDRPEYTPEAAKVLADQYSMSAFYGRYQTYINCWHQNDGESAAMWSIYGKSNESIAVVTTYRKLIEALDQEYDVGNVIYVDYEKTRFKEFNAFLPFIIKRKSFQHEREVRAVRRVYDQDIREFDEIDPNKAALGLTHSIDLRKFVVKVHVAPTCTPQFVELVKNTMTKFGSNVPVFRSELDKDALF